jgi:RNA polymerase sigma-70 factor (ECF subfamily)
MLRAFEKLADRHRDRIFTFACYVLGDREEAEDVTQEVLIRLWKNLDSLEEDRTLPWLLHVTRNACIDALRRRRTYRALVAPDPDGDAAARVASRGLGPAAAVEAADFRSHLERAVRELAEPYRSIVILREIQDLRYEEICEALGLPLNTVKVYLHRARRKLREKLREFASHGTS